MIFVKLYHLRIVIIGDKTLETKGKVIPCIKCGASFKSYCSYGFLGYTYRINCRTCELLKQESR